MFTGIINHTGEVKAITESGITVSCPALFPKLKIGGSVATDGTCLTITLLENDGFYADVMPETADKTIYKTYQPGSIVNLELPVMAGGRFEGHMVSGHVETGGTLSELRQEGNATLLTVQIPENLMRYVVPKGSIALNGISLTITGTSVNSFSVSIIPHTWSSTNLHFLKKGDNVNVETDLIAKHIEKLI